MGYTFLPWIIAVAAMIMYGFMKKRGRKRWGGPLVCFIFLIIFVQMCVPGKFWGTWDAIPELKNRKVTGIILTPSEPAWEVNLNRRPFLVTDAQQVDSLLHLLQEANVCFPSHPQRIWETRLLLLTAPGDTLALRIDQTDNNGTLIYTAADSWRRDELGAYLERLTQYRKPVYADSAVTRF